MPTPWCMCGCHQDAQGTYRAAKQLDRWTQIMDASRQPTLNVTVPVDVTDAVEAAVACPECLTRHCPALLERRIWFDPPDVRDPSAWVDGPPPPIVLDPDGD